MDTAFQNVIFSIGKLVPALLKNSRIATFTGGYPFLISNIEKAFSSFITNYCWSIIHSPFSIIHSPLASPNFVATRHSRCSIALLSLLQKVSIKKGGRHFR